MQYITIPGQTRSKKNSKVIKYKWLKGKLKPFITSSKLYKIWATKARKWIRKKKYPAWDGEYPIEIKFFLYRANRRKWDVDNILCGPLDVLQETGILTDDDVKHVIPVFCGWTIDQINPRVELMLCKPKKQYFREDLCVLKPKKGKKK